MKDKTLIKTKIVLEENGTRLVTYFCKKSFWIFGYWYVYGFCSCSGQMSESKISKINDRNVSETLYNQFLKGF